VRKIKAVGEFARTQRLGGSLRLKRGADYFCPPEKSTMRLMRLLEAQGFTLAAFC